MTAATTQGVETQAPTHPGRRAGRVDPIHAAAGERVRNLRQQRRISQKALGAALGVSFQQVQKYEQGTNRMSLDVLVKAARALEVDLGDLLRGLVDPAEASQATPACPVIPAHERRMLLEHYTALREERSRRCILDLLVTLSRTQRPPG